MANVAEVLVRALMSELRKAEVDGLLSLPPEIPLELLAGRLAHACLGERVTYRSGRRGFDRVRDALWEKLRYRIGGGRRVDD